MAGPEQRALPDSARMQELEKRLADVRHVLALRLEVVAQVSQRLAEVCNEVEACFDEAHQVTGGGGSLPAGSEWQRRQDELSEQMGKLWLDLRGLEGTPDWWRLVQQRLEAFDQAE